MDDTMLLPLSLLACGDKETDTAPPDTTPSDTAVDADGDGYSTDTDCDDTDAAVNPGAEEVPYSGTDEDCDDATPDDDLDGDGHGIAEDCDDSDSSIHPGAVEDCDDGIDNDCDEAVDCAEDCQDDSDNDGDGLTDCHDDDCTDSPWCQEVCDDGEDNDVDGLTDCQDGDCFTSPVCVEDCSDGVDNDEDGLTDCDDDDCWVLGGCIHGDGVFVTVTGGSFTQQAYLGWGDWSGGSHSSIWRYNTALNSVTGDVRVLEPGEQWSTATDWTTCEWRVQSAWAWGEKSYWGIPWIYSGAAPTRVGFEVDSGCDLSSSWFLPGYLRGRMSGAGIATQTFYVGITQPWYNLQVSTSQVSTVNHTWGWGSGQGRFQQTRLRSGSVTGSSYHAMP